MGTARLSWAIVLMALAGCGSCVADLSGSRCNPDGRCGTGYLCRPDGRCARESACFGEACDGRCVDAQSDVKNCGGCGVVCPPEVACIAGGCACAGGLLACAQQCIDPTRDVRHCDDCGAACAPDGIEVCGRSRCVDPTWALWSLAAAPSYSVTEETTVDLGTGLLWERRPPPGALAFTAGKLRCDTLTLAGFTDWRLPSRVELISLLLLDQVPTLDPGAFPGAAAAVAWSASPAAQAPGAYWTVDFATGMVGSRPNDAAASTRCVR